MKYAHFLNALIGICILSSNGCQVQPFKPRTDQIARRAPYNVEVDAPTPTSANIQYEASYSTLHLRPPIIGGDLPENLEAITLEESLAAALSQGDVLRSLGGTIVEQSEATVTKLDPLLRSTDPNYGIDAALANFDTQFQSSLIYQKNDNVFNNRFLGAGAREVQEGNMRGAFGLQKTAGNGSQFAVTSFAEQQNSTSPDLLFPHSWTTMWEAKASQPLLRGSGTRITQIAGPNYQPGFRITTGVLLAQVNANVSQENFKRSLAKLVRETTDAYWQLWVSYQNYYLARQDLMDVEQQIQYYASRAQSGLPGAEADKLLTAQEIASEARSRIAYSLGGDPSSGRSGLLQAEANLRRLMGLPTSTSLLQPTDSPTDVPVDHDWDSLVMTCLTRSEIREQNFKVQKARLELEAAKNYRLPQLDATAIYRNNGFGDNLFGGSARFSGALNDAASNDHGEYEVGLNFEQFLGTRRARNAVKHYELTVRRELAILHELEDQIVYQLGTAVRRADLASEALQLHRDRLVLSRQVFLAKKASVEASQSSYDSLLEQKRKLNELELERVRLLVARQSAFDDIHFEAGRILQEYNVHLIQ